MMTLSHRILAEQCLASGLLESLLGLQANTGNQILKIFAVLGIPDSRLTMVPR